MWIGLVILIVILGGLAFLLRQGAQERKVTNRELSAIVSLSEQAAQILALQLLSEKGMFICIPATTVPPLEGLPESVKKLFQSFEEVRRGEFWLAHAALKESVRLPGYRKIGEDFEFEEIVVHSNDSRVYSSYSDVPEDKHLENWPSVWHRIVAASERNVIPDTGNSAQNSATKKLSNQAL